VIIFDEKIVGIWFLSTIPNKQDWLAAVREIEPDAKYELTYRFRYYKDDKPFDSEDKKNWYQGQLTGTRLYVIAAMRSVGNKLAGVAHQPLYEVMNDRGVNQFMRDFEKQPWAFARRMSQEEAQKEGLL
jgi:hypothetical protein